MVVDYTINLGHIISLVGALIAFLFWANSIKWSILNLDKRVEIIEKSLEEQTKLTIANAVVKSNIITIIDRLGTLEKRVDSVQRSRETRSVTDAW